MLLHDFIRREYFQKRLQLRRVLVIYDHAKRYRDVVEEIGLSEHSLLVDTSAQPLGARLKAWRAFDEVAADASGETQLIVYVPHGAPVTDDDKMNDPFRAIAIAGAQFPKGAGDDYLEICRNYLPDRVDELQQLFDGDKEPSFDMINSLRTGGVQSPRLQAIFKTDNVKEIFIGFLCSTEAQKNALNEDKDWSPEFRAIAKSSLGFNVNGNASNPDTLRSKLWQYLLFSEFAADLPDSLPNEVIDLPRAEGAYITLVNSICDRLREPLYQEHYAIEAEEVETKLNLKVACKGITEFGERDTFSFEERSFLGRFTEAVLAGNWEESGEILEGRKNSLWANYEERQLLWTIARFALQLLQANESIRLNLKEVPGDGKSLTHFYTDRFSDVDTTQRLLEQAVGEADYGDGYEEVGDVIDKARSCYRELVNELQAKLFGVIRKEGWPFSGVERNSRTFDRAVAPFLEKKQRVVYFMVDGLRYEFGAQLDQELARFFKTEITPACAFLPCVTRFGMASLLPGADSQLKIGPNAKDKAVPLFNGSEVLSPDDRLDVYKAAYGDRCDMRKLEDLRKAFSSQAKTKNLVEQLDAVDLLVVRSQEIDHQGESQSDYAKSNQPREVQAIIRIVRKLAEHGNYQRAVIGTDHGFFWIDDLDKGDAISAPTGDWALDTRRCRIGSGDPAPRVASFSTSELSMPTEWPTFIVPEKLALFRATGNYFHEGLSFQESLLPVLSVDLSSDEAEMGLNSDTVKISLNYKQGKTKKVFILRPSIEILAETDGLNFGEGVYRFRLEVMQGKKEVGQPTSNPNLDSTTNLVSISPGPDSTMKMTLSLYEDEFEGDFEVRAIDPDTDQRLAVLKLNFEPHQ